MATLTTSWQKLNEVYVGTYSEKLYIRIYALYTQQDIANNRTYVKYQARTYLSGTSSYIYDKQGICYVSGAGTNQVSNACTRVDSGEQTWATTEGWINHDQKGECSISCSARLYWGNWGWDKTATGYASLPTIPRQADLTNVTNFNDEQNPTITYTNPAGNSVTSLEACISLGSSPDITYRPINKTGTQYTFQLTEGERNLLRNSCTTSNERRLTFFIKTVMGGKTYYDSMDCSFSIVNANPTINGNAYDTNYQATNLTGYDTKIIKGYNNVVVNTNATTYKGATIKSYSIKNAGTTYNTQNATFVDAISPTFELSVIDSRGNIGTSKLTLTMVDYIDLTAVLTLSPPNAVGDLNFNITGSVFNGSFGRVNNTLTIQYRYKENYGNYGSWINVPVTITDNTYKGVVNLKGLNYKSVYTFQGRAIDKLQTIDTIERKTKTSPVFDWSANDFNFNVPVNLSKGASGITWNNISEKPSTFPPNIHIHDIPEPVSVAGWDEAWKFPSGLMILETWDEDYVASSEWKSWGGCYDRYIPTISNKAIPAGTFTHRPRFFIGTAGYGNGGVYFWFSNDPSGSVTKTPQFSMCRPNTSNYNANLSYCLLVVGRWK